MLRILLVVSIIATLWFFFTQVFVPIWNSRRLFPLFRKDLREAQERLEEVNRRKALAQSRVEQVYSEADAANLDIHANKVVDETCDAITRQNRNTLDDLPRTRIEEECGDFCGCEPKVKQNNK